MKPIMQTIKITLFLKQIPFSQEFLFRSLEPEKIAFEVKRSQKSLKSEGETHFWDEQLKELRALTIC